MVRLATAADARVARSVANGVSGTVQQRQHAKGMKPIAVTVSLAACLVLQAMPAVSQIDAGRTLAGADVPTLIEALLANADLTGNVVLGIAARERLAERGHNDPESVVPAVMTALRGPAASDAVPALAALLEDDDDQVRAAAVALQTIDTAEARQALAADGTRYATADIANFRSLRQSGSDRIDNLLRTLPEARPRQQGAGDGRPGSSVTQVANVRCTTETIERAERQSIRQDGGSDGKESLSRKAF